MSEADIPSSGLLPGWSPSSWREKPVAQDIAYRDPIALERALTRLRELPPLVTSWEIERLKAQLAEAGEGKRFVLQGGDCAETLADCRADVVVAKLKILLQMSLVLIYGAKKPVVRIGRLAGQYAKPRSSPHESKDGVTLPSYFGDLVNRREFTAEARRADPELLLQGYTHAALTLNFVRSLAAAGFADLHHPEQWDLVFAGRADLDDELRDHYTQLTQVMRGSLAFMEALGERSVGELGRVEFFTSHEGLNLHYEEAQTRTVPRRLGAYDLTTHLPWIGERTRALDGAHVEFFRGIANPVGVKLGPKTSPADALALARALNARREPGKMVFISRMGKNHCAHVEALARALRDAGEPIVWLVDPMHGNTRSTASGQKTRDVADILAEIQGTSAAHERAGTHLAGVHVELTGDDVTECVGGEIREEDLDRNYATVCDPRLNYRQSLELAFAMARQFR